MKKRLTRVAPLRAAIVLGILGGFIGVLFAPIFLVAAFFSPKEGNSTVIAGLAIAVLMPFFFAAIGFLSGLLGAALYNLVAKWTGGLQVDLVDDEVTIP
jgi:hypothetical protein